MDTKEKIITQTFNLIMKYGIKSVSLDDISRGIGISKKTIYQYFDNKKALIYEVMDNHILNKQEEISSIIKNSQDSIDEMLLVAKHVLLFLREMSPSMIYDTKKYYPKIWEKVQTQHFQYIQSITVDNINRGQSENFYSDDIDADIVSKMYVQQIINMTDESIFPLSKYRRSDLYKSLVTHHIRGLLNDNGRKHAQFLKIE